MVPAHCRQNTAVAKPRRFSSTSACSRRSRRSGQRLAERAAQHQVGPVGRELFAHVHDRHRRERPIEHAALEHDAFVAADARVVAALHRRRRRPEHDQRVRALAAHDRHVAAVVARALVLLVRPVVLLVHDDQADALERREHRRPRADDDVDVAAADPLPLVVPLAVGERRCAARPRARRTPRGTATTIAGVSAISGTSISTRRPDVADGGRQPQVDLRLAAARHAVHERHVKAPRIGQRPQARERRLPVRVSGAGRDRRPRHPMDEASNGSRSTRSCRTLTSPPRTSRDTTSAVTPRSASSGVGRPPGAAGEQLQRVALLRV